MEEPAAGPCFEFGFDTEEFSDRILRLQFEDGDVNEPGSTRQVSEAKQSRRKLERGRDVRNPESSMRTTAPSRDIKVNSIILAAHSDFFRTMLLSGMREGGADKPPIVLKVPKDDEYAIVTMLQFMYSGILPLNFFHTNTLVQLLVVGDKYQCASFVNAAAASLESVKDSELTIACCNGALSVLEEHVSLVRNEGVKHFLRRVKVILLEEFKDVAKKWQGDAFLKLSRATVAFLLQSEKLEAASEGVIFKNVLEWVNRSHSELEEKEHLMLEYSQHIRYRMIGGELLRAIMGKNVMRLAREKVMEAVWFRSLTDGEKARVFVESDARAQFQDRKGVLSFYNFLEFPVLASRLYDETDIFSDNGLLVDNTFWQLRIQETEYEKVGVFLIPTRCEEDEPNWQRKMRFDLGVKVWPSGWRAQIDPMYMEEFTTLNEGCGNIDAFDGLMCCELSQSEWVDREGIMTLSTYFRPA